MAFLQNRGKYPAASALGVRSNICDIYTKFVTSNILASKPIEKGENHAHFR